MKVPHIEIKVTAPETASALLPRSPAARASRTLGLAADLANHHIRLLHSDGTNAATGDN